MVVQLSGPPQSSFDQPIGLLSDCHRRVEKFLRVLSRVVEDTEDGSLDVPHREALDTGLRYFKNAAPWHTQDEEFSLFPRLRSVTDARVTAILAEVDRLEGDHAGAAPLHHAVDALGRRWLELGRLSLAEVSRLGQLLHSLAATYARHIAYEDEVVFPLAAAVLSPAALRALGREMAERRGVEPNLPPRRCKHRKTHAPR